jgi:phosphoribosyl-AMP cyclohydrolase
MNKLIFSTNAANQLIASVDFAKAELIPAIAVDVATNEVLMQAWINKDMCSICKQCALIAIMIASCFWWNN